MGPAGPQRAATPPQPQHLQSLQALPAQLARNLNMLRHSPQHPQGLGLMRTHHQQVSTLIFLRLQHVFNPVPFTMAKFDFLAVFR